MTKKLSKQQQIDLGKWYQETYGDEAAPSASQWQALLDWPEGKPLRIVNFFKMAKKVSYEGAETVTGEEAFSRYTVVSMPALEKAGGEFLMVAPFGASFVGASEDWDLVAIGSYPDKDAVLNLFQDEDYKQAWQHRAKACSHQRVMLVSA